MAQYALHGVYGFAQPQFPPAKATMVPPADPRVANANYLPTSRYHSQETPLPRVGRRVPPPHSDLLGPSAAKISTVPLGPAQKDPFAKYGRMSFESTIPAPVATSTEHKFLPFKADTEVNFADQNDTPPTSIFSSMQPLELVERLIKGVSDPERKESFEAVRKYLMRIELIRASRALTTAEDSEYGTVVNGLRANALDAFGDGSTQFATMVAYDLGIQFGLSRITPPAPPLVPAAVVPAVGPAPAAVVPAAPVIDPFAHLFAPGAPSIPPSLFMPPAIPAPVPGPSVSTSSSFTAPATTTSAPVSPVPTPSAPVSPTSAPSAPGSPTSAPVIVHTTLDPAATLKVKKAGPDVKMPPEMRVMIAKDFLKQGLLVSTTQQRNADRVIDKKGEVKSDATTNSAFDSMQGARKKLHKDGVWQGKWYRTADFQAAVDAKVEHPSMLPGKTAATPPASPPVSPTHSSTTTIGSGRHPYRAGSYLASSRLRRGFGSHLSPEEVAQLADEMVMSHEWNPSSWM